MEYDEFGNPIGEPETESGILVQIPAEKESNDVCRDHDGSTTQMVPLQNQLYPTTSEVYGDEVEVIYNSQDSEEESAPIVKPESSRRVQASQDPVDISVFHKKLLGLPSHVRNVAIVGHTNHGKTSLLDALIGTKDLYTDAHILERGRGLTLKLGMFSSLLQSTRGKSYAFNFVDTPGHPDFWDELAVALRLCEGLLVVVDASAGPQVTTYKALEIAALLGKPCVLVLNKVDRLFTELCHSPAEAYQRLEYVLDEVNDYQHALRGGLFSPVDGNVVFASVKFGFVFTLDSVAEYLQETNEVISSKQLASQLWGDIYYKNCRFTSLGTKKTFVEFILDPIRKILGTVYDGDKASLASLVETLDIRLTKAETNLDLFPLARRIFELFWGDWNCLVDSMINLPEPIPRKQTQLIMSQEPDSNEFLGNVVKLVHDEVEDTVLALVKVFSGSLRIGQTVQVVGLGKGAVESLSIPQTRYRVPLESVCAGNWALVGGLPPSTPKNCTIGETSNYTLAPINYLCAPIIKLGIEPLRPQNLPQLVNGLQQITKLYGCLESSIEDSGEHLIYGPGELYLDCVMYELRNDFAKIEINVSDPATVFQETCVEESYVACPAQTSNYRNKMTVIASPIDESLNLASQTEVTPDILHELKAKHHWDTLSLRSLWAVSPRCNMFLDDTVETPDWNLLSMEKEAIVEAFHHTAAAGPLCEEPLGGVQFKLMNIDLDSQAGRNRAQVVSMARSACAASLLVASPRLMEPVYRFNVVGPLFVGRKVYAIVDKRRGKVLDDTPIPGTSFFQVSGEIPALDSFGFESQVRAAAQGQAEVTLVFDRFSVVPGNPLDFSQKVKQLQPAEPAQLARDILLKTRRRKGLSREPSLRSYVEDEIAELLEVGN